MKHTYHYLLGIVLLFNSFTYTTQDADPQTALAVAISSHISQQHAQQVKFLEQLMYDASAKDIPTKDIQALHEQFSKNQPIDEALAYQSLKTISELLPTLYKTPYHAYHEDFCKESQDATRAPRPSPSSNTGANSGYPSTSQLVQAAINNALNDMKNSGSPFSASNVIITGTLTVDKLSGVMKASNGLVSAGQVTTSNIANNAVTTAKIADDAVTTAKIPDLAVTNAKLATIIMPGKVSNTATTATSINTGYAIVARDADGSFLATGITLDDTIKAPTTDTQTITNSGGSVIAINKAVNLTGDLTTTGGLTVTGTPTFTSVYNGFLKADSSGVITAHPEIEEDDIANGAVTTYKIADEAVTNDKLASGIDATKITVGTLDNDRTTATPLNYPSTIVERDASGNFEAGTITADLSGNVSGTSVTSATGNFTNLNVSNITTLSYTPSGFLKTDGSGVVSAQTLIQEADIATGAVTNDKLASGIDAAKITTGTLANARLDASTAATNNYLVLRDSSGNFAANIITADKVTNLATPQISSDAATKAYVDSQSQGFIIKTPARLVAVSDVPYIATGTGIIDIDGVPIVDGNYILLTDQTDARQNGLWIARTGGTGYPWERPTDFEDGYPAAKSYVLVSAGDYYAGTSWYCTNPTGYDTIGSDDLTFVQFTAANAYTMANLGTGNGAIYASRTGNQFNLKTLQAGSNIELLNPDSDYITVKVPDSVTLTGTMSSAGATITGTASITGTTNINTTNSGVTTAIGNTGNTNTILGNTSINATNGAGNNTTIGNTGAISNTVTINGDTNTITATTSNEIVGTTVINFDPDAGDTSIGNTGNTVTIIGQTNINTNASEGNTTIGNTSNTVEINGSNNAITGPTQIAGTTDINKSGSGVATQIGNTTNYTGIGGLPNASYALAVTGATRLATSLTGVLTATSGAVGTTTATDANTASTIVKRDTSGNFATNKVTGLAAPSAQTDAANKYYVDERNAKNAVQAVATANVASLVGPITIDGYTLLNNDRILLTAQSTGSQNGIWIVSTADTWTRPADFYTGGHAAGAYTCVQYGTTYKTTNWLCTTVSSADVIDTNSLTFAQFVTAIGGSVTITGGTINGVKFGNDPNYSAFDSNGRLTFYGNARTWEDVRVPLNMMTETDVHSPTWRKFMDCAGYPGSEDNTQGVYMYHFSPDTENDVAFMCQMPHSWYIEPAATSITVYPHVHWHAKTNSPGNIKFGIEMGIAKPFTQKTQFGAFATTKRQSTGTTKRLYFASDPVLYKYRQINVTGVGNATYNGNNRNYTPTNNIFWVTNYGSDANGYWIEYTGSTALTEGLTTDTGGSVTGYTYRVEASDTQVANTQGLHYVTDIPAGGFNIAPHNAISSMLICRFYRVQNSFVTGGLNEPLAISEVDFHFQQNTTGSQDPTIK